jgi:hypothetical protein
MLPNLLKLRSSQLKQFAAILNNIATILFGGLVVPIFVGQNKPTHVIFGSIASLLVWSASVILIKAK